jgi:hypothetical protein
MKALCIVAIYLLMWFFVTLICKYIDAKNPEGIDKDDTVPNEFLGLLWPVTAPILILMGLWLIIKYVGKMMDKFIDKIIITK